MVKVKMDSNADEVRIALKKISDKKVTAIKKQVFDSAMAVETEAKKRAPSDTGDLRGSITHVIEEDGLKAIVGTNKKYAPFREFGTGKKTRIPSGFGSIASKFRGSGGFPPVHALRGWARRHGFQGLEFVLARHIFREGTKPQPFLIPAFEKEKPKFEKAIENILKKG